MRPCAVALISAKELERLCRYITRPAIANQRLKRNPAGQVVLQLKSPYRDGTTHIVMSPLELMQRLAALVPRPRLHLIRFHGVLAPHATLRAEIVPSEPVNAHEACDSPDPTRLGAGAHELGVPAQARVRYRYATLLKLWRPPEDHRRDRRPRADYQDPHPPAPAGARTAQITGAASRSVPSGPSGLIAHSSSLPSGFATKPTIPFGRHSRKRQNCADMGHLQG